MRAKNVGFDTSSGKMTRRLVFGAGTLNKETFGKNIARHPVVSFARQLEPNWRRCRGFWKGRRPPYRL